MGGFFLDGNSWAGVAAQSSVSPSQRQELLPAASPHCAMSKSSPSTTGGYHRGATTAPRSDDVHTSPLLEDDDGNGCNPIDRAAVRRLRCRKTLASCIVLAGMIGSWIAMSLLLQVRRVCRRPLSGAHVLAP